jgi:predicted Zn-dependent protease
MMRPIKTLTYGLFLALGLAGCAGMPVQNLDVNQVARLVDTAKKVSDSVREIQEPEEIQIGGEMAATLLGAAPLVNDPELQRYVNRVGLWVALQSERPGLPWKFGVLDHPAVNAYTTPGGYVLITRGLYQKLRSESELAGVLAHEVAHVLKKHHLKAIQKSAMTGVVSNLADMYSANTGGSQKAELVRKIAGGTKELYLRGLDRGDEYEADRMGVVLAARAGYNPYGLVGVLQTLAASQSEPGLALMLKTHPSANDRLNELANAMGDKLDGDLAGKVDNVPRFGSFSKMKR